MPTAKEQERRWSPPDSWIQCGYRQIELSPYSIG